MGARFLDWIAEVRAMTPSELLGRARSYFLIDGPSEFLPAPSFAPHIVVCLALSGGGFSDLYPDDYRAVFTSKDSSRHFLTDLKHSLAAKELEQNGTVSELKPSERDLALYFDNLGFPGEYWRELNAVLTGIARLDAPDLSVLRRSLQLGPNATNSMLAAAFLNRVAEAFLDEFGCVRRFAFVPRNVFPSLRSGPG